MYIPARLGRCCYNLLIFLRGTDFIIFVIYVFINLVITFFYT